jgi:hypothetical protein
MYASWIGAIQSHSFTACCSLCFCVCLVQFVALFWTWLGVFCLLYSTTTMMRAVLNWFWIPLICIGATSEATQADAPNDCSTFSWAGLSCCVRRFLPAPTLQYILMNTIFHFCYLLSIGHPLFTSLKVWMLHFISPLECCSIGKISVNSFLVSEEVWQAIVMFWRSFCIWSIVLHSRLIILNDQAS